MQHRHDGASASRCSVVLWLIYCVAAFVVGVLVRGPLFYAQIAREDRPVPGQLIDIGNGNSIFVRDPSIDHKLHHDTVPNDALHVVILSGLVIMVLLELTALSRGGSCERILRAVAVWLTATAADEFFTDFGKHYVAALRPNFYDGCNWSDVLHMCTVPKQDERHFRNSFPSGHSSHSACFAMLVTLHLLWHADAAPAAPCRRRVLLVLSLVPAPFALFVAVSRVHDNWHHPADVVAGLGLGSLCAALTHRVLWVGCAAPVDPQTEDPLEFKPLV